MKTAIDGRTIDIAPGTTVLEAAQRLGIEIPTLCYLKGYKPSTSCLVCMVKVRNTGRFVPACGTQVFEGMEVESETAEVHGVRRTALELLLSDHVGDCLAPCHFACPAHMDVPLMLRQIKTEDFREAIQTVKRDIALPAVLGRICPAPCEKGCRRKGADGPVAVCGLKRYVADQDMASPDPYVPARGAPTGLRVAIVGAGPTGLSAAYYLAQQGHTVAIFDDQAQPGGRLRCETTEAELPRRVLDQEIELILRLGIEICANCRIGEAKTLDDLRRDFDVVLVACGAIDKKTAADWGLVASAKGIEINRQTYQTNLDGVFAAGNAIRTKGLVVRSVADGKEAARAIHEHLHGQPVGGHQPAFSVRMGKLSAEELSLYLADSGQAIRLDPSAIDGEYTLTEAVDQAGRCLHCDCRAVATCKLKRYAAMYGADPGRYAGERAAHVRCTQHSHVIYEPGKCINCGLCIEIASRGGEPLGLAFVGRGFDVRVGVPFNRTMEEALGKVAAECVAACPTAALSFKDEAAASQLPILGQPRS